MDPKGNGPQATAKHGSEETRFYRELDYLYRFAGAVGSNLDVDTLLDDSLPTLLTMSRANRILVALFADKEAERVIIKQRGLPDLPEIELLPQTAAALGTDAVGYLDSKELPKPFNKALAATDGPWAVIPLSAYGRQLGLLVLGRSGETFDETTLKLLNTAGRQLAMAVENSRLFDNLQQSYGRLVDTQEELIQTERLAALGGLAATMAHEIRNPLATIFSSLSQIRKHAQITGDSATLLEIAEEEAIRLNRMVGGLLEFARPRIPRVVEIRPGDIVKEIIQTVSNSAEFPEGAELALAPEAEDIVATLDPDLFRRTIQHLVANSVAAIEPEKGKISIGIEEVIDPDEGISVTVCDNGSGINPEVFSNVFEPFFTTRPSGVGLGLPVVKRIVEDHGGFVEIDSAPGRGTRIQMLFSKKARGQSREPTTV
ncbi:MAG: hypothetical protein GY847_35445 [Proteobacteria bacterium]|nr:hypothetical protein [Pseudomonadota bacterium]